MSLSRARGPGRGTAVVKTVLAKHFLSLSLHPPPALPHWAHCLLTESETQGTGIVCSQGQALSIIPPCFQGLVSEILE